MKKIYGLLLVFSILNYSCEVEKINEDLSSVEAKGKAENSAAKFDMSEECTMSESILYAGQHTEVGKVTVTEMGGEYVITYMVNEGYCLSETHLSVGTSPEDFPINNGGNPKIGNFEYSDDHGCVSEYSYTASILEGNYIAAHAVVKCVQDDVESIGTKLPEGPIEVFTTHVGGDAEDSYFNVLIKDGELRGTYDGWCVDTSRELSAPESFTANAYSSYEDIPEGVDAVDKPENLDLVNWILNQDFVGKESSNGELFTFGDVQWAIWELIDSRNCRICEYLPEGFAERGAEIVAMAMANGDGFIPECGQNVYIILVPTDNSVQRIIIPRKLNCGECEETAWASGCNFPGGSWATYFQYGAE